MTRLIPAAAQTHPRPDRPSTPPSAPGLVHVWSTCHRSRAVRNGLQRSPAAGHSRRSQARSCGNRSRGRTLIRMRPEVQVLPGPHSSLTSRNAGPGRSAGPCAERLVIVTFGAGWAGRIPDEDLLPWLPFLIMSAATTRPTAGSCGPLLLSCRYDRDAVFRHARRPAGVSSAAPGCRSCVQDRGRPGRARLGQTAVRTAPLPRTGRHGRPGCW